MPVQVDATTVRGQSAQARLTGERWAAAVETAMYRASVVERVLALRAADGLVLRGGLSRIAPDVAWSTWLNWRRKSERGEGPAWERQLDERVPPSMAIGASVDVAIRLLREVEPSMSTSRARELLQRQFGEAGNVGDSTLRRVWAEAGQSQPPGPRRGRERAVAAACAPVAEVVERYYGGAGLALLVAADTETDTMGRLASAIEAVTERIEPSAPVGRDEREGRDSQGQFTGAYNEAWREAAAAGEVDDRWRPDASKAARRDLSTLRTVNARHDTLTSKLFAMGATPLLTERRGFDGLAGPSGEWLAISGGVAYMPATLDKTLAELGLLDVGDALWDAHAAHWSQLTRRWRGAGPAWLQTVAYVDGTADPYWTRAFAKSGKVSRVGRVMPCLTRIALNSGAGVPLLVQTHAGAAPLKTALGPMLERLRVAVGPDAAVDRLTVVDSEAGKAGLLTALHEQHDVFFITVIKGAVLKGASLAEAGPWSAYRERDELCESTVHLRGKDAPEGGLRLRAVQMRRPGGRHPQTTVFATNACVEDLSTQDVAAIYLDRWPRQEQTFRDARNGGGLNRSFGFGREAVEHLALTGKKAKAETGLARATDRVEKAEAAVTRLKAALADAPASARREALALAKQKVTQAHRAEKLQRERAALLESMPAAIIERDVGRDAIMTCLKLSMTTLVEYVHQEYFGHLAADFRTYIEQLVALPVTIRTTPDRRLFQIHANLRQPERMAQLDLALQEINRRNILRDGQRLEFELVTVTASGPRPGGA